MRCPTCNDELIHLDHCHHTHDLQQAYRDAMAAAVARDVAAAALLAALPRCGMRLGCPEPATFRQSCDEGAINCCADHHLPSAREMPYAAAVRKLREVLG